MQCRSMVVQSSVLYSSMSCVDDDHINVARNVVVGSHERIWMCLHTHLSSFTNFICTFTRAHTHAHTYPHAHTHSHTHTHTHTLTHTLTHTHTHTHSHTHTHTHSHTHTHTHSPHISFLDTSPGSWRTVTRCSWLYNCSKCQCLRETGCLSSGKGGGAFLHRGLLPLVWCW